MNLTLSKYTYNTLSIVLQLVLLSSDMNHLSLIQSLCPIEGFKNKTGIHILTNFYRQKWQDGNSSLLHIILRLHILKRSMLFTRFNLDVRWSYQRMIGSEVLKLTVKILLKTRQLDAPAHPSATIL